MQPGHSPGARDSRAAPRRRAAGPAAAPRRGRAGAGAAGAGQGRAGTGSGPDGTGTAPRRSPRGIPASPLSAWGGDIAIPVAARGGMCPVPVAWGEGCPPYPCHPKVITMWMGCAYSSHPGDGILPNLSTSRMPTLQKGGSPVHITPMLGYPLP